MPQDNIVLSYHDTVLRETDIHILKTNNWLTDSIIGFYLQYLEKEIYINKGLLFMSPEVTQCIKSTHVSEIPIFLDPLQARKYLVLFFPVNNNENVISAGGSHWSLLVYHRPSSVFFHFDSSSGMNHFQAFKLGKKLQSYFNKDTEINFRESTTLQQSNSYDCGIHLICNVENITKHVLSNNSIENANIADKNEVKLKRASILTLIYTMQKRNIHVK